MKKVVLLLMTAFVMLLLVPAEVKAEGETGSVPVVVATTSDAVHIEAMATRLGEIKAMDFSTLNSSERKELRKEVRSIKGELKLASESDSKSAAISDSKAASGGVYLSVGAAILIVVLLILLL